MYYQNEIGQILVYLKANISNMFLAQYWKIGTSSRSFYAFNEMKILLNQSIFDS